MKGHVPIRRLFVGVCVCGCLVGFSTGLDCGGTSGIIGPLDPPAPSGNLPPRVTITSVMSESNNTEEAEQGEIVSIQFNGEDGEDRAMVRLFASQSSTPSPAQELPIAGSIPIGPGAGNGSADWDTTSVPVASYFIFAEIDDGVNPPVRVIAGFKAYSIAPQGSQPRNDPPKLVFLEPRANLGLSSQDLMTIRYVYSDTDNPVRVTLLLDKDRDPSNDDINNPGDPLDPNTNIIILPSEARRATDPTFDGDPPPPDDPNNPPGQADSLEIRTNPRILGMTAPGVSPPEAPNSIAGEFKEYIFTIDFSRIPVRTQPYFVRATIADEDVTVHQYATGSLTITRLANGVVDATEIGFSIAGARFQGFSTAENLGSDFVDIPDIDGDAIDEMLIASRYASPRNRFQAGAAYLIFGRRKVSFPLDTNGNGLPDVIDGNGNIVDFPPPPTFVTNPYDAANVGRFGGLHNINSVNSFFRGTTYGMPEAHDDGLPPEALRDPGHLGANTAGLTSIARLDMTGDGIADLVFGLPFISNAREFHDDDPVDGGCDTPYGDGLPNQNRCTQAQNDDIAFPRNGQSIDEGLVIVVDGTNDLANTFRFFTDAAMAGQNDPGAPIDDENILLPTAEIPIGMRFRGGWFDNIAPIVSDNEYGHQVAAIPSIDNDTGDELVISIPGYQGNRGRLQVWFSANFLSGAYHGQAVLSLPSYVSFDCSMTDPSFCRRGFVVTPRNIFVTGRDSGDRFGNAQAAGEFNQDGPPDLMAGAPGANRDGLVDNGVFYVFFTPAGGFGDTQLASDNPPRLEIHGIHDFDRFGDVHTLVRDINADGIDDVAFASESFDDNINGNADAGYVGVIFGRRPLTGENGFSPNDVGTPQLSGVRFFGATVGARAGHDISSAGDFNRDNVGDFLISCPGERRDVNVGDTDGDGVDETETRLGVAYLIFGGTHLINKTFNLSEVGNPQLPGIVFISRFVLGSVDQAEIETVGGIGDIDGDGFDDIAVAAPTADFVNLASPDQRRVDAGEVYIIYGNNFGSNNLGGP